MKTKIWNADNGDGTYSNPILYTDYSDPDAIRVGEDYYMVASSFCNVPGIPVLHSKDLVNWELINYVVKELPEKRYDRPIHGCGVWAPSIRYHEGTYYVCFPMPDEGIFMSTTKDPYGDWSEPINIRPGAGWIDPCPFWDEDGKAYLVAGVAKSRIGYKSVLHLVEMRPDGLALTGEEKVIFDGNQNGQHTIEGPKLYKRNGWYYIFAPAGGVKEGWQTVLRAKNIYGPYEFRVVLRRGDTEINGPHQGAWVDTVTGEDWFLHFQDVYAAGRILHLQPMSWENDWPVIGVAKDGREFGEPVLRYQKPDVGRKDLPVMEPEFSEDFTGGKLGLSFQWNANEKPGWYQISENGLSLYAQKRDSDYVDMPNVLLEKWPAPEFSVIYHLDLSKLSEGEEAGVISMGMEYGILIFQKNREEFEIKTVSGKQFFEKNLSDHNDETNRKFASLKPEESTVYVKYMVERIGRRDLSETEKNYPLERVTLWYSTDKEQYTLAFSMEAVPGRWVGVKNGLFCCGLEPRGGSLLVKSVNYHRIYHNPVQRGFFPDPSVVRVGEDYYMVNSSFQYFPAIPISHSKDMIHWELIGHAITDPEDLDLSDIRDSHGIWAPDIAYENGRFFIFATLRLNGDGKRDNNVLRRQLMVSSEKPEGPYSHPVWLEVDDIDPSLFTDVDGKHYMLISPGVNLVPLNADCTKVMGGKISVWPGTGERCPEGPHLLRHGEYYYAILAEGGTGYGHGINVARSKNLWGPYEPSPYNPVLRQTDETAPLQRCGHGKLIEDHQGNWWVYYLCGRPNEGKYTTIGRETALEPVQWLKDGWFVINHGQGPSLVNEAPEFVQNQSIPRTRDDFEEEELDKRWQFVRKPSKGNYSLSQRKGWLRIWTQDGTLSEIRAKNTLVRREQEHTYMAQTKLEFWPSANGEQAGLTCYYSTATYVRFSLCYEEGRKLQVVMQRNHGEELVASVADVKEQAVYLKVCVDKLTRRFFYSYDGENWELAATLDNCVFLCDEGVPDDPKRHTGTLVGIYANNGGRGSRIPADFDFFEYVDDAGSLWNKKEK